MDRTDIQIINLLQKNARMSTKDIAQAVSLSAPAAAERITRLKENGVIEGFCAKVNDSRMGNSVSAYVQMNVPPSQYDAFCSFCAANDSVTEHHHIIGINNALLKIRVKDTNELESLLEQMRKFGLSNTSILLSTYFTQKDYPGEKGE